MLSMKEKYDVAVIGAGPSGIAAANCLAKKGLDIIIFEKRPNLGPPVKCAEFVPKLLYNYCKIPKDTIGQEIEHLETHLPDCKMVVTKSPGYILNRHLFEKHYLEEALNNGANLSLHSEVLNVDHHLLLVKKKEQTKLIEATYIIGADGPLSVARKYITTEKTHLAQSLQCVIKLQRKQDNTQVYFHSDYYMGYGWVFPKGPTANIGLGISCKSGVRIKDVWGKFLERLRIDSSDIISFTGGLIPASGLLRNIVKNNVILIGDAAGITHPITGAGIANGIISGEIAASIITENGNRGYKSLEKYEKEIQTLFGRSNELALKNRRYQENHWTRDPKILTDVIKNTWIAFPSYSHKTKR